MVAGRLNIFHRLEQPIVRIVAALVLDQTGRVLLVRKRGTKAFMQPGGKLQPAEAPLEALGRELQEELTCSFSPFDTVFLGTFTAPAANEEGFLVEAALYRVQIVGQIRPAAEIEEVRWLYPEPPHSIALAPLTRERVLPLAQILSGS